MATPGTTEILLSKRKLVLFLAGALLLVALGGWFVLQPEVFADNPFFKGPALVRTAGVVTIGFFGIIGFFLARKLTDSSPGLVITNEGFIDNSSGLVTGLVRWADVAGISELVLMRQQLLLVKLHNPHAYIERQTNPFKRQLLNANLSSYGSPIHISANALQCTYAELRALLLAGLATHGAKG